MGEAARRDKGFMNEGVREYPWNSHDGRVWREVEKELRVKAREERAPKDDR